MNRLAELATVSDAPDRLTRLYLSPAHKRAIALVEGWMREAGLETQVDAIGNLIGRTPGARGRKTLLIGSHIDTVRDAGAYDGNFGVLAAISALQALQAELPFPVEIIAFGDEEGARFPTTLAGSRAISGTFDNAALAGADETGITLGQALAAFGCDPQAIPAIARNPAAILGFIELHIEQGPVLEAENLPVGIVTAINGAARFTVTVTGMAGHAGTVPMALRKDALAAAAAQILAIQAHAAATPDLVATVGALRVHPGAPNTVPGRVTYTIDIRAPDDRLREQAISFITNEIREIAVAHKVLIGIARTHEAPATPCAPWLQERLANAVAAQGIRPFHLPSGAGHDAMAMAALCPVGMLFLRCKAGISHAPEESITEADAEMAVSVLVEFLRGFEVEN